MKKKNKYQSIKLILSFIILISAGAVTIILPNALSNVKAKEITKKTLITSEKTKTFGLSTLCAADAYESNVEEFLNSAIDCKKVLNVGSKSELLNTKNGFIKVVPSVPKAKQIKLTLTVPNAAENNETSFTGIKVYDPNNEVITGVNFSSRNITNRSGRYFISKTTTNAMITLALTAPKIVSKIIFDDLQNDLVATTQMFAEHNEEIRNLAKGKTSLNSVVNATSIQFDENIDAGTRLVLDFNSTLFEKSTAVLPNYQSISLYDENDILIATSEYSISTVAASTNGISKMTITFQNEKKIKRVQFNNFEGKLSVKAQIDKIIPAGETKFYQKSYRVNESFDEQGLINLNDFTTVEDEAKFLSKLQSVTLLNNNDEVVPFSVTAAKTSFTKDVSIETCETNLECTIALQPRGDSLRNGINLTDTSYFAINSLHDFSKMKVIGDNVKIYFTWTTSENLNFDGIQDWQEVDVTAIENKDNPQLIFMNSDALLDETIKFNCKKALKGISQWALPKACDFLTQVLPTTNEELTNYGNPTSLSFKATRITEYPWWDIQKILFNENANTMLELDFESYISSNIAFNNNLSFYIENLFKNNAERLDKLVIKGPLSSSIATHISKLTSLSELVLDGAQVNDFNFLNTLSNLKKITIMNTELEDVSNLLEGSLNITDINLSNNLIKTIPNSAFSGLTNLVSLNLSNNMINQIEEGSFPSGSTLFSLNLANNQIENLPSIASLTNLQELNIGNNKISLIPSGVVALSSLRKLIANNNLLTLTPISSTASSLEELDISNNPITSFPTNLATMHPALKRISFGGSYELNKDANNSAYQNLISYLNAAGSNLTSLKLEGMNLLNSTVSDLLIALANLSNLQLEVLSLKDNQLTNFSRTTQAIPTTLKELNLANQNGLSIIPKFIEDLTALEKLDVSNNSFSTIQKLNWPSSLKEINVSSNPLSSYAPLINLAGIETIIATSLGTTSIGADDYISFADGFESKVNIIISDSAFEPQALYDSQIPFKLSKINLMLGINERKKVDFFDQYLHVYEDISIRSLRDQLRLDNFKTSEVINYVDDTKRIFYSRPVLDYKSISDNDSLETYLDSTLAVLSNVAKKFQLDNQMKEVKNGIIETNNVSVSSNTSLIVASTLVVLLILTNSGLAFFYFFRKKKAKK